MPRGTQLSVLRSMLKAEVGYSLDSSATGKDGSLNQLLSNKQQWLASEFDWPFLEHRWDVAMTTNTRYYSLPTTESSGDIGDSVAINFDRPVVTQVFWGSRWIDVEYGVGAEEFNFIDSDHAQVLDPVQRWRLATDTSETTQTDQFEVWPVPSVSGVQTFRFTGQRTLKALSADADKADLDDMLLVYMVAAEQLARLEQADAQLKTSMAQERLRMIRASYPTRTRTVVIGSRFQQKRERRVVPLIAAK